MSDLTVMNQQHPSTMSASSAIFNVQALAQLTAFANLMADSTITVPAHFVGKPADCMAVVMQAMQWGGMNPYAVAQKTYLVNGVLGYEAQLVNAVVTSSTAIRGRFHYEYGGDWSKCTKSKDSTVKKPAKGGGTYEKIERVRDWSDDDEQGLFIRVGAIISGEDEVTWGEPVYFSSVVTRNSPLWVSNPKQQIAYLAVKYWARLYCPEVILGVYTPDEVEQRTERDVTPPVQRASISQMSGNQANVVAEQPTSSEGVKQEEPVIDATSGSDEANFNYETLAAEFRESIDKLQTLDSAKNLRVEIEDIKQQLGNSLYTELKGKAVKKYHQIDARNYIEAAINSLDLGSDSRAADFAKVEQDLKTRKSKLGDELFDGFTLTLDDLRVEFS